MLSCPNFWQWCLSLLLSFRRLTACMVAEYIFGDRFVWQFLVDFLDKIMDRFWTFFWTKDYLLSSYFGHFFELSTISLAHSGQLQGALLVDLRRLTACMVAECIFGDRLEWENAQASQRKHQNELTQFFTLCFSNTSVSRRELEVIFDGLLFQGLKFSYKNYFKLSNWF